MPGVGQHPGLTWALTECWELEGLEEGVEYEVVPRRGLVRARMWCGARGRAVVCDAGGARGGLGVLLHCRARLGVRRGGGGCWGIAVGVCCAGRGADVGWAATQVVVEAGNQHLEWGDRSAAALVPHLDLIQPQKCSATNHADVRCAASRSSP
eukprot:1277437-Rhodomonas_salina.2